MTPMSSGATFCPHFRAVSRLAVLFLAISVWVAIQPLPAVAQTSSSGAGIGALQLLGQSDWVQQGQSFDLSVKATTSLPLDQVELVVTVFNPVANRTQYLQTLENKISGTPVVLERHTLSDIVATDGTATISLPIQDTTQKRSYLRNPGIYPVRVDLQVADSSTNLAHFVTHIINEPSPAATKLGVTSVFPVQSPQSLNPAQPFVIDDRGNSVNVVARSLTDHPTLPLTVVAEPETVDRLQRDDNGTAPQALQALRSGVGNRPVLDTTYTPISTSLYANDLTDELNQQFTTGKSTLTSTFNSVTEGTWAATESLDTDSLNVLKSRGNQRIVVQEQDLAPQARDTTLARPFKLSTGKAKPAVDAGQADAQLAAHFADPDGPILGAHRLLADLAVIWNDRPGQQRSVIVMPPRSWSPDPGFLETYLRGITSSPVVVPLSVDDFFKTPVDGTTKTPTTRQLATSTKPQGFPSSNLRDARTRVEGLRNISVGSNPVIDDLEDRIMLSERADLDNRGHSTWVESVRKDIDRQISGIRLPSERSIRLTARQGEIPVTVQNDNGYAVRVQVQLQGDKLAFPDGNSRSVDLTRQYVTERFAVDAKTSGAFGVQVRIESPDGRLVLDRSEITIRSTATSSVGLGLSVGAIGFLFIWWIRSAVKTRRKKAAA